MPHTHDVDITGDVVRKSYVSWAEDEPGREWAALVHLDEHAPGLGPRPIARLVVAGRPVVTMSRVPGTPLTGRVSPRQAEALVAALRRLFAVHVPPDLPIRTNDPVGLVAQFRPWLGEEREWGRCSDPRLVRRAVDLAQTWLDAHPPTDQIIDPVVAIGDGNLDNVLWDGQVCRLIDWEEHGASDLAYEVADLVEHASSRLERRLDVVALLRDLAPDPLVRERVEHQRRLFACFWLAMLLPGNRGWLRNPPGSAEDQAQHLIDLIDR